MSYENFEKLTEVQMALMLLFAFGISVNGLNLAKRKMGNKAVAAIHVAGQRNTTRMIPRDLMDIFEGFVRYDWERLLDVFQSTANTQKIRDYVKERNKFGALATVNRSQWAMGPFAVDSDGDIIEIDLYNQRLTNSDIGDLSKLPSTLKVLNLRANNLISLDVAALPRGLEVLILNTNHLDELDFTKLPSALFSLFVHDNELSAVNLTKLPRGLENLWLKYNHLTSVDLSALPPGMVYISLDDNELTGVDLSKLPRSMACINLMLNHLDDAHFGTS